MTEKLPEPRLDRLSNGLRVVTETIPGLGSAAVGMWIDAGARHETESQNGIAHFLEHMAFKGTGTRSALRIAEEIEDVGGFINAWTSRETTAYYARVLKDDLPLAMELVADILLDPLFAEEEIETERGVILQEIGQALDTPDDVIFDWLQEEAYRGQPLGRSILGPADNVNRFTRDDLLTFTRDHYGPDRMVLAAAGAVDHDDVLRRAEALFGHLEPRRGATMEAACFTGGVRRVVKPLEQSHFALALEGPGFRDEAIYAAQIHATVMGGGMSSRLFQRLREERGLCYTIFAQSGSHDDTGMTTIYAGTSAGDLPELSRLVGEELSLSADDIRPDEVARARAQLKAGLIMGIESPSARAERMARLVSIWNRVPSISETIARIDDVTTGDVKDYAAQAAEAQRATAVYGPEGPGPVEVEAA